MIPISTGVYGGDRCYGDREPTIPVVIPHGARFLWAEYSEGVIMFVYEVA